MNQQTTHVSGTCHCGNIRHDMEWPGLVADIKIRNCGCTFCQKHGGAWTSHPDATLEIAVRDPSLLNRYRFGTKTADFLLCRYCGVVPAVVSEIDGRLYAVVNVNSFTDVDTESLERSATDFDGEETGSRLARRRANWIGRVTITGIE